jgi:POT family proton-dependent oligopeptide transporter
MGQTTGDPGDRASDPGTFLGHPAGLRTLFFTEMWERFSYYGMKPLMVLYMPLARSEGGLGFDDARAGMVLAIYSALVYFTNLPGGQIADRWLGQQRAVFLGGLLILSGHVCLIFHGVGPFFAGLGLIVAGTGLLKPNMTALVGQLYPPGDARRDAGFSLYYLGINTGAFLAPLVCGFLAQHPWFRQLLFQAGLDPQASWHFGFAAAAVGMFFGLVQFARGRRLLVSAGRPPARRPPGRRSVWRAWASRWRSSRWSSLPCS